MSSPRRYAYLGPEGTFTEAAVRSLPEAGDAVLIPCSTVGLALEAVHSGIAEAAAVPIENSVEGVVPVTLDSITNSGLMITREMHVEIQFSLLARPGTQLDHIKRVATHPHAESQCRGWLARHLPHAEVVMESSTAYAAAAVAHPGSPFDAAIAAPVAAATYGLVEVATAIADRVGAVTRFVLVTTQGPPPPRSGADRTSLVAYIHENRPGALLEVLEQFSTRGIDLTWIQSRPTGTALGKYCFAIDCEGHVFDARVGEAMMGLRRTCDDVRFLGSYPKANGPRIVVPQGTSDADFADAASWLDAIRRPDC